MFILKNQQNIKTVGSNFIIAALIFIGYIKGQGYGKGSTDILFTFHLYITVHYLHQTLGYRHPQTGTVVHVAFIMLLTERFEYLREIFRTHTGTGVSDDELKSGLIFISGQAFHNKIN